MLAENLRGKYIAGGTGGRAVTNVTGWQQGKKNISKVQQVGGRKARGKQEVGRAPVRAKQASGRLGGRGPHPSEETAHLIACPSLARPALSSLMARGPGACGA